MPTAFVTGGSGFVGGRLIERLVADGWTVRALARSQAAAETVAARGASPVAGDVTAPFACDGADVLFHAAAKVEEWGPMAEFERVNVGGTRHAAAAARAAGARLVHVGTESALMSGEPLHQVDETAPLALDSPAPYARTKARAEQVVLEAGGISVRPRFVWGRGDTTLLPAMLDAMRSGKWAWIGGGRHLTATTHVDNTIEGLLLAASRGEPGRAYFVTDGEPVVFREFVSELARTQGVEPPARSLPAGVARAVMEAGEALWRLPLPGAPPVTRTAFWLSSHETTIDDSRARRELGYAPVVTREAGLAELRGE